MAAVGMQGDGDGKSPTSVCPPAGRSDHWLGRITEPSGWGPGVRTSAACSVAEATQATRNRMATTSGRKCFMTAIVADGGRN